VTGLQGRELGKVNHPGKKEVDSPIRRGGGSRNKIRGGENLAPK